MSFDLVPTAEAAEMCRVTVSTFNKWASEGVIATALQGSGRNGARFFARDEVEKLRDRLKADDLAKWAEPAKAAAS